MPSSEPYPGPGRSGAHREIGNWLKEVAIRKGLPWGLALLLVLTVLEINDFMFNTPLNRATAAPRVQIAAPNLNYKPVTLDDLGFTEAETVQDRGQPFLPCGCFYRPKKVAAP